MSMDYSQFSKFLESVEGASKDYNTFLRSFLLNMAQRALGQTKALTPVDEGTLRERWKLSDVYSDGKDLYVVLYNPLEYASFIEDGHMQHRRFLPIKYLDKSVKGRTLANKIRSKYGEKAQGFMLEEKWIPGYHMARISINKVEQELPQRFERAFVDFLKKWGVV